MWIYSHVTMSTKTYLKSEMILLSTSPVKSMIKWRPIAWGWRYVYHSGSAIVDYNGPFLSFARLWFQWHCNTLTLWIIINKKLKYINTFLQTCLNMFFFIAKNLQSFKTIKPLHFVGAAMTNWYLMIWVYLWDNQKRTKLWAESENTGKLNTK